MDISVNYLFPGFLTDLFIGTNEMQDGLRHHLTWKLESCSSTYRVEIIYKNKISQNPDFMWSYQPNIESEKVQIKHLIVKERRRKRKRKRHPDTNHIRILIHNTYIYKWYAKMLHT